MSQQRVKRLVIEHEGVRHEPYRDSLGLLTIGIGRCLDTNPLSADEITYLFDNDMRRTRHGLIGQPWFRGLDPVRQAAVIDMTFQMGLDGFLKFKKTIQHIAAGRYKKAAKEMLISKWAKQTPGRAKEVSEMMATGEWPRWMEEKTE